MKVVDVMNPNVGKIPIDATIREAARKMATLDTDVLAVSSAGSLCGILTCRDIVTRVTAAGHKAERSSVRDAMTQSLAFCFEDQDVNVPASMMRQDDVSHVLVLDSNHQVIGKVSPADIAASCGSGLFAVELVKDAPSRS